MSEQNRKDPRDVIDDVREHFNDGSRIHSSPLDGFEKMLAEGLDDYLDAFSKKLKAAFCAQLGHKPTIDHCGLPEHDYCAYCLELTPGQAKRVTP
jgi:hypothetical protein